jgi:hypothetical protein
VVAGVAQPLIGADFLSHFGLLVDSRNNSLLDIVMSSSAPPNLKVIKWRYSGLAPLHVVPKKDNGWCPCGDCRALKRPNHS